MNRPRERVPTGRRGRPSKSMIAAALERPFCAYLHKICLNNRLEGHKYCIDHIMNDKTAPYRQCTFVHAVTGRRCTRAAHKVDRKASPLCLLHRSLKINAPPVAAPQPSTQVDQTSSMILPLDDNLDPKSSLIEDLAHHKREGGKARAKSTNTFWVPKEDGSAVPSAKLCKVLAKFNHTRKGEDLAAAELPTMEEIAARHNNADSDTESVDNNLDMFKHASVFTDEELTRTLRDKMIKLRRLYIEQYGHIQYILKEKRLKYIQAQRIEDELYGELYSFRNNRSSPDYAKLRAMLRYHKTFGPESLLQEQAKLRKLSRPPTVGPHAHPNHPHLQHPQHQRQTSTTTSGNSSAGGDNASAGSATAFASANATTTVTSITTTTNTTTTTTSTTCSSTTTGISGRQMPSETRKNICIFSKTPQGCDNATLPLSPYCKQHILYDSKQVLFRPCAGGIPPCLVPVVSFTKQNKCWLHKTCPKLVWQD